ncbi:hypothetical protein PGT21_018667 [Puccinia graminis f. sp. tritici]|uniref:Uncharacterized protein n=1 Tax=Puccinia graminis f. sp. tritici TaxID=56615 RepID=A0A5B0MLJ7_PUCGR|nr:hypothetical protein PGT21_018667 [Puccinia graminis f. sp. tritici]
MMTIPGIGPNTKTCLFLGYWGHSKQKNCETKERFARIPNMTTPPANYTLQSIVINQLLTQAIKLDPPKPVPPILWSVSFLEPAAGILYVLSSIPAIRKEGFWFLKIEKNGMVRPNTRTIIPMFVLVYIVLSMATIYSFQKDVNKSYLSTVTITLSLCTYPFMLCTGWTRVWNVLGAVPLTKYGLINTTRQANADSTMTYFKPRTINLLSIFLYAFPFVFAGPPIYFITLYTSEITQIYKEYNDAFLTIIKGNLESATILQLNVEAFRKIASMQKRGKQVLFLSRLISIGYCLNIFILFFMMLFGYLRILQAVRYQIRTFRQALQQHIPLTLNIQSSEIMPEIQPTPVSAAFHKYSGDSMKEKQRRSSPLVDMNISSWLPSLRHDPDFLEQSCSSMSSNNSRLNNQQPWEINNQIIIQSQCKALKIYQVNLVWQVICNSTVMIVLAALDFIIFTNFLQIPTRHPFSYLTSFVITVASVTWIFTIGIPFGLVAVIVAFSSPITTLREKSEVVNEFDY